MITENTCPSNSQEVLLSDMLCPQTLASAFAWSHDLKWFNIWSTEIVHQEILRIAGGALCRSKSICNNQMCFMFKLAAVKLYCIAFMNAMAFRQCNRKACGTESGLVQNQNHIRRILCALINRTKDGVWHSLTHLHIPLSQPSKSRRESDQQILKEKGGTLHSAAPFPLAGTKGPHLPLTPHLTYKTENMQALNGSAAPLTYLEAKLFT